jgi:tetratricopeptide (TPR) repeat protein
MVHLNKGNNDEAIKYNEKLLEIKLKKPGENQLEASDLYNNIGLIQFDKGNYDEAMNFYHKSLEIRLNTLG